MDDIYKNIEEYNPNKKRKILVVFDNLIADMLSNKYPVLTELFIRGRKLNISCFYYTTLFCSPKKYYTKSHTILSRKFQINETFNKSYVIIHQTLTLTLKSLGGSI